MDTKSHKLTDARREMFYAELHALLTAGLDFSAAFRLLIEGEGDRRTKALLEGLYAAVVRGETLADAMRRSGAFRPLECGVVRIGGVPISQLNENQLAAFRQKHIGFVFQSYNLLPELTAAENVAMPLMFKGIDPDVRLLEAKKMLCRVGLKDRMDHFPNQMSGGQQQRVGIARAFVTHPEVVFADEPTGNLDTRTTKEVMHMIRGFAKRFHQTIVLVSHDPEMTEYADRIVTLIDGRIVSNVENQVKAEIDAAPYIE